MQVLTVESKLVQMNALKVEVQEPKGRNPGKKHNWEFEEEILSLRIDVPSVKGSILEGGVRAGLKDATHVEGMTTWLMIIPRT